MDNYQYAFTLEKEIYLPETNVWDGGRTDVIFCQEYEFDAQEARLLRTNLGAEVAVVSRDNIAAIVYDEGDYDGWM